MTQPPQRYFPFRAAAHPGDQVFGRIALFLRESLLVQFERLLRQPIVRIG
jgi:hypothetical protein